MKDEYNKGAHESSAQMACEAAGAIRTVASLTREKECCDVYSKSLEEPLRRSNRTALWSNLFYATSQACIFFSIALVFWFGSLGVANQEYGTTAFFVAVFVSRDDLWSAIYTKFYTRLGYDIWRHSGRRCIQLCARHLVC
jgi:ATP-binding cassette subfamily B (MDR/TAP) protein 1